MICLQISAIVLFSTIQPVALQTSVTENTSALEVPLTVNLIYWGYSVQFTQLVPVKKIVQESYFHDLDQPIQFWTKPKYEFWTWLQTMNYTVSHQSPASFSNLLLKINSSGNMLEDARYTNQSGESVSVSGYAVSISELKRQLLNFESKTGYTIHIFNISSFFLGMNVEKHWYMESTSNEFYQQSSDFRNMFRIADKSIIYDPTAWTPFFTGYSWNEGRLQDRANLTAQMNYLIQGVTEIIENIILGSPYSNNYHINTLHDTRVSLALVVLTNGSDQTMAQSIDQSVRQNRYQSGIYKLIGSFLPPENFQTSVVNLSASPNLQSYLNSLTTLNGSRKELAITGDNAETIKNLIRREPTIYSSFPEGYFYLNIVFAYDTDLHVLYTDGKTFRPYNSDFIGLGITDLHEWVGMPIAERNPYVLHNYAMQTLGNLLGIHHHTTGISQFIETPMSEYHVNQIKALEFTDFEADVTVRKYAMLGMAWMKDIVDNYPKNLGIFGIVPHDEIYNSISKFDDALELFTNGSYAKSAKIALEGYEQLEEDLKTVDARVNATKLFFPWLIFVIFLAVFIILMNTILEPPKQVEKTDEGIPAFWYKDKTE